MGGLLQKVEEESESESESASASASASASESEIEIDDTNLEEEASSSTERKRNHSDQPNSLNSETIQNLMEKVNSTLQQNPDRNMKEKSTIPVFYYHPKNENRPMADEETPEDSADTSDDSSDTSDDSPSKPLCPPGDQDAESSTVTLGEAKAE